MTKTTVEAVLSFENVRKGDVAEVVLTPRLEGLIKIGYLKVVGVSGKTPNRSRRNKDRVGGGGESGTSDRIPTGDEPSEDPEPS